MSPQRRQQHGISMPASEVVLSVPWVQVSKGQTAGSHRSRSENSRMKAHLAGPRSQASHSALVPDFA